MGGGFFLVEKKNRCWREIRSRFTKEVTQNFVEQVNVMEGRVKGVKGGGKGI